MKTSSHFPWDEYLHSTNIQKPPANLLAAASGTVWATRQFDDHAWIRNGPWRIAANQSDGGDRPQGTDIMRKEHNRTYQILDHEPWNMMSAGLRPIGIMNTFDRYDPHADSSQERSGDRPDESIASSLEELLEETSCSNSAHHPEKPQESDEHLGRKLGDMYTRRKRWSGRVQREPNVWISIHSTHKRELYLL